MGRIRRVFEHFVVLYAALMEVYTHLVELVDVAHQLLELAEEARENVRAELEVAAREKRATDATEARIRRALSDVGGKAGGDPAEGDGQQSLPGLSAEGEGYAGLTQEQAIAKFKRERGLS